MKAFWQKYISDLFFTRSMYIALAAGAFLFAVGFFLPALGSLAYVYILFLVLLILREYISLFFSRGVLATRTHADRFSNGDDNPVGVYIESLYNFPINVEIIDEVPFQFQRRDILFKTVIPRGNTKVITYPLRPVKRGIYTFGSINVYAGIRNGLLRRRFRFKATEDVPVYPSYLQMRKYQLMAVHNRLDEAGIKKVRRIGHSMEFEQIKEYVRGDDYRTLNWKATARKGAFMVNHYTEEKSQQVYCIIDKGRVMKMPFDGMSLLDYAINASLVLSNIALMKQDRAGLITFSDQIGSVVLANKKPAQMEAILEVLYGQKTRYLESDFERLYTTIRTRISQRSLIVLFTNFESMSGLRRQMPYLRKIARHHLLLVVFFENTGIKELTEKEAADIESIYIKTIGEKFSFEKKMIVKELQQYGILSILTPPEQVTVNALNKYLEIKARHAI